jgi:hypothetical protein
MLRWLKTVVVSDEGKGARDASGRDPEDDRCRSVVILSDDIRTRAMVCVLG